MQVNKIWHWCLAGTQWRSMIAEMFHLFQIVFSINMKKILITACDCSDCKPFYLTGHINMRL